VLIARQSLCVFADYVWVNSVAGKLRENAKRLR
jgi:hypothetical protein